MNHARQKVARKLESSAATVQRKAKSGSGNHRESQEVGVPRWLQSQHASGTQAVAGDDNAPPLLQRKCAGCAEEEERLHPKLRVNQPGDAHEQEADRVADQVMRMPAAGFPITAMPPQISRKCAACAEEEERLQKKDTGTMQAAAGEAPAMVHDALRSPGDPLDASSRAYFEPRFGRDFGGVRVHRDGQAAASARAIDAQAYTAGQHIAFAGDAPAPHSDAGRRLLAHELTHTVQQSPAPAGTATVQRSPDQTQEAKPAIFSPFGIYVPDPHPLSFRQAFHAGPIDLSSWQSLRGERSVTHTNIIEWAVQHIWSDVTLIGGKAKTASLVKMLRRGEDQELHNVWHGYVSGVLGKIEPFGWTSPPPPEHIHVLYPLDNPFIGEPADRRYWAKYLFFNWAEVDAKLDQNVTDLLVAQIKATLYSGLIPAGATLVRDPKEIRGIEDAPSQEVVEFGRWGGTATVGTTWMGKRIKSALIGGLVFEVIGHEGVYFEITTRDLMESDPFMGQVIGGVVAGTKGIASIGRFIKGFLTALASPVIMVLDTAAKIFDMANLAVAAFGKWSGWYDIGYLCLSSTCQHYEECLKSNKKPQECQDQALEQALKEATIIIPIYEQGRDCLVGGDEEACGAIAALALGLVAEGAGRLPGRRGGGARGGKPLSRAEFEDVAIRERIGRPRAGDPHLAQALEKPKAVEAAPPATTKAKPAAKPLKPVEAVGGLRGAIDRFARRVGIKPKQLEAEVNQLRRDAPDPSKVNRAKDARYDAEMHTAVEQDPHTFRRERGGNQYWCRFTDPKCGVPVGPEIDAAVTASLKEGAAPRKAASAEPAKVATAEPPKPPPSHAKRVGQAEQRLAETKAGVETKQLDVELARDRLAKAEQEHAVAKDLAEHPGGKELLHETELELQNARQHLAELEKHAELAKREAEAASAAGARIDATLAELAEVEAAINKIYEPMGARPIDPPLSTPQGQALKKLKERRQELVKQLERDVGTLTGELSTGQKGRIGEAQADAFMDKNGFEKIGSSKEPRLEGGTSQEQGLDGVYRNRDPQGRPKWVVGEAKYVTDPKAKPTYGKSKAGKQGTKPWSDANLDQVVGKKMADQIRREGYEYWELRYDPATNTTKGTKKF
jgi:hypothetical protein